MKQLKLIISTFVIFTFASCTAEFDMEESYENLPYLSIEGSIELESLSEADMDILLCASARIKFIQNIDGLYEIYPKTAERANVSKNIFDFFNKIIESSNEFFEIQRSDVISRAGLDSTSDCVVQAIVHATGMDYSFVFNHVLALTGLDGVTDKNLDIVLGSPRFGGLQVDISALTNPEVLNDRYVIIYHDPETMNGKTWHAVNGWMYANGDNVICNDYQHGVPVIVHKSLIISVYKYQ